MVQEWELEELETEELVEELLVWLTLLLELETVTDEDEDWLTLLLELECEWLTELVLLVVWLTEEEDVV